MTQISIVSGIRLNRACAQTSHPMRQARARRHARARRRLRRRLRRAAARQARARRSSARENFMLYTPLLPEAASGTLEPRHVVVPLRLMCPHAELLLGPRDGARRGARGRSRSRRRTPAAFDDRATSGSWSRSAPSPRTLPDPRARRARARLQGPRRRDRAPQPRPAPSSRRPTPRSTRATPRGTSASSSSAPATRASRRSRSSPTSSTTRCATTRACARRRSAGCSSTRRRRSCPRSRRGSANTPRSELAQRGVEIHVGDDARVVRRRGGRALGRRARSATHTLVWTAGREGEPAARRASACRSTSAAACGSTSSSASRAASASGRSATAPRVPNDAHARASPTRRRASTRSARRGGSRRTSPASRSRTATACSARWRRSAATRASPTCSGLRLRGFPGWFVTRTYHLYQLPLFSRKLRVVADWTIVALLPPRHRRALAPQQPTPPRLRLSGASPAPRRATASSSARPRTGRRRCAIALAARRPS